MTNDMKQLVEKISADSKLKRQVAEICESGKSNEEIDQELIALAKELGLTVTAKELDAYENGEELSDDELEAVTGGGACACVLPGGGGGDGLKCGCFTGGNGRVFEYRPATDDYLQLPWDQGGCVCAGAGAGATNRH